MLPAGYQPKPALTYGIRCREEAFALDDFAVEENLEKAQIPDTPLITDTVFAKNDIWLGDNSIKITEGDPLPMWAEKNDGTPRASHG